MFSVQDNTPSAGFIQWTGLHMSYLGQTYTIQDGNTNYPFVWWLHTVPSVLVVGNTLPNNLTDADCIVFVNKNGIHLTVPTATILDGDLLVPGSILAAALAAGSVTADKIAVGAVTANALAANAIGAGSAAIGVAAIGAAQIGSVDAGSIQSGKLSVGTPGAQRTEIYGFGATPYIDQYDASNVKRSSFNYDGLSFYDAIGNRVKFAITTGAMSLAVGPGQTFTKIQDAINSLPLMINHSVNITLYAGTYNENVLISGFIGTGQISIGIHGSDVVNVASFNIQNCTCEVDISGCVVTTTTTNGILAQTCRMVKITSVTVTSSSVQPAFRYNNSIGFIMNCTVSNRSGSAIQAYDMSYIQVQGVTFTNCGFGLLAVTSQILDYANTYTGTSRGGDSFGGLIIGVGDDFVLANTARTMGNLAAWDANGYAMDAGCNIKGMGFNNNIIKQAIPSAGTTALLDAINYMLNDGDEAEIEIFTWAATDGTPADIAIFLNADVTTGDYQSTYFYDAGSTHHGYNTVGNVYNTATPAIIKIRIGNTGGYGWWISDDQRGRNTASGGFGRGLKKAQLTNNQISRIQITANSNVKNGYVVMRKLTNSLYQ